MAGDATPAYGENVERYRRHLLFMKPDVVVIADEVRARNPVSLKFWLHGRAPFTIDPAGGRIALTFEHASLAGCISAPGGLTITQTDQYPIPPETGRTRPEWHASAETNQKQTDARIIAVLSVGKAGEAEAPERVEDASLPGTIAVRYHRNGKPVTVAIDTSAPSVRIR